MPRTTRGRKLRLIPSKAYRNSSRFVTEASRPTIEEMAPLAPFFFLKPVFLFSRTSGLCFSARAGFARAAEVRILWASIEINSGLFFLETALMNRHQNASVCWLWITCG